MNIKPPALLLSLLTICWTSHIQAQTQPKNKVAKPASAAESSKSAKQISLSQFDQHPFNPNTESLPPAYKGHSCEFITARLRVKKTLKDEFETTSAYESRVATLAAEPLYSDVSAQSIMAFVPSNPLLTATYDADTQTMLVDYSPLGGSIRRDSSTFIKSTMITTELLEKSTYFGSNSFGSKVSVTRYRARACAVAWTNVFSFGSIKELPKSFSFTVPAQEAKSAKDSLAVLFVAQPKAPFYAEYSDYAKPTIDHPTELVYSGDSLLADALEVWIFDKRTGKVFIKSPL